MADPLDFVDVDPDVARERTRINTRSYPLDAPIVLDNLVKVTRSLVGTEWCDPTEDGMGVGGGARLGVRV